MRFTSDQRLCLSPCTTNPTPLMDGGDGPKEAAKGQADYGPGADIMEGIPEEDDSPPPELPASGLSIELKCDTTA